MMYRLQSPEVFLYRKDRKHARGFLGHANQKEFNQFTSSHRQMSAGEWSPRGRCLSRDTTAGARHV